MVWRTMAWMGVLASLAMAEGDIEADPDAEVPQTVETKVDADSSTTMHTARTWVEGETFDWENDLKLRLTGGIGISSYLLSSGGRVLTGKRGGHLVYGFQALDLREIPIGPQLGGESYPDRALSSCHALVGADPLSGGAVSWLWLGGFGVSFAQGPMKPANNYEPSDRNVNKSTTLPTIFLGTDLGISFGRNVGLSLQAGAVVSRNVAKFFMLQLDVGTW
ncbi:MAG: hypothetical protein IPN71_08740 [Fibrobacteres bacterium]|jgi:hypothetical protein|nr:hypothetical protein [Fibrobacterota bacterium]